jgi:hypothetical protein
VPNDDDDDDDDEMALGSLLPSHLETRSSECRSATGPHRNGILNDK